MAIIYNHIWHILLFSCTETDRTKIYEESDIKTNTQTSAQLSRFCRRVVLVPSVTTRQKPQAEARACIPCVSLLLKCFKYLNTLCFASFDVFQVPEFRVFCFFWYIPSTCITCVSLLLICFKYLPTLCFASFDVFQVPIYPVFRWCCSVSSTCARNISFFRYISSTCMHASAPQFWA